MRACGSPASPSTCETMLLRLGCGGGSAAIVIVGTALSGFPTNGVVFALLLPSLMFVMGVWRPWIVRLFGTLLLGITGLSWGIFWANRHSSTGGLNLMAGAAFALLVALAAVCVQVAESVADRGR